MREKDVYRSITFTEASKEMQNLVTNYMLIYDEYYKTGSRDSAFLKDLMDATKGICACLEVYATQGHIEPEYALQKLKYARDIIGSVQEYYLYKLKEDKK